MSEQNLSSDDELPGLDVNYIEENNIQVRPPQLKAPLRQRSLSLSPAKFPEPKVRKIHENAHIDAIRRAETALVIPASLNWTRPPPAGPQPQAASSNQPGEGLPGEEVEAHSDHEGSNGEMDDDEDDDEEMHLSSAMGSDPWPLYAPQSQQPENDDNDDDNNNETNNIKTDSEDQRRGEESSPQLSANNEDLPFEKSPKKPRKLSLQQYVTQSGASDLEAESHIVPPHKLKFVDAAPIVRNVMVSSKIENTEAVVLGSAISRLQSKMKHDHELLDRLQSRLYDEYVLAGMPFSLASIWQRSSLKAEVSRKKQHVNLLRDMRMQLLQLSNDWQHEELENEAKESVYLSLRSQVELAQTAVQDYRSTQDRIEQLNEEVTSLNSQITDLKSELRDLGEQSSMHTKFINASVLTRASQLLSGVQNSELALVQQQLTKVAAQLNATATINGNQGRLSMPFFCITVDLQTMSHEYFWNCPPILTALFDLYKQLVRERRTLRGAIMLWHRALEILKKLKSLMNHGLLISTDVNLDQQIANFVFYIQSQEVSVQLNGTSIIIHGSVPGVRELEDLLSLEEV